MKFVVSHLDQQMGPFDEQELRMKWAAGEILPIDYVFDESKQDWILLAERFAWAAKPLIKETNGAAGGPPPVKEGHIMKRMPPAPRSNGASQEKSAPAPQAATPAAPAPTPAGTTVVSANNLNTHSVNIAEGIKLSEPLKLEPLKAQLQQPIKVTEVAPKPAASAAPTSPAPVVTQAVVATTASTQSPAGAKLNMVNGVGELELDPMRPGEVALVVQNADTSTSLKMTEPLKINVKASEPVHVEWTIPAQQTVGQDVEILIRAIDNRGLVCSHYYDDYLLVIRGPVTQDEPVKISEGKAIVMLNHIKAESWNLTLQYSGPRALKMPESHQLEWMPGAAARLVLDGNHEFLAGDHMKVQVKAVDAYGNTARTFQGTVVLEVKAS